MIDMLTRKELRKPPDIITDGQGNKRNRGGYKLSLSFIREHAAEMGAIGNRPQLFNREHVERVIEMLITERIRTHAERDQKVEESKRLLDRAIRAIQSRASSPSPAKLDWRGGRKAVAS